ncbi:MAG: VacB/RNase II family 3'-5' exoribonuclease [Halomonadaceae bacterium]|nr:MAG: VacB/RNase II family 3'-5' exoribonuclease [Halomonadaceae bacterium]
MLNADSLNQLRQLRSDIKAEKIVHGGTIKRITPRFGFVALDDGRDVYLPQEQAQLALVDDRVTVTVDESVKGKPTAALENVEQQTMKRFIGQYQVRGKGHFVVPDVNGLSRWFFVPPKLRQGAAHGDYVECRVSRHPYPSGNAQAEIQRIIGAAEAPGIERSYALARHELHDEFPEPVLAETEALSQASIDNTLAAADSPREDLTGLPFVTIDAPSTQDLDDAVSARAEGDGWVLSVAIADPVALLPPEGVTEQEARLRGSAGYFPGQPRPMLPPAISQELGSLVPDQIRLALVMEIPVAADGSLGDYRLVPAQIRCRHKLSYESVSAHLESKPDDTLNTVAPEVLESLTQLGAVTTALRQWRSAQALLSDERPDYRLRLNDERRIRSLDKRHQTPANRLIEDAMIAANRCAADFLAKKGQQGLYICHAGIRQDRLDNIRKLINEYCPELADIDPSTPEGFRALIQRAPDCATDLPVKSIVLRQLERADMSLTPAPHQGMGLPAYTTMTSPLRKYSDYLVHRWLHAHLGLAPAPSWNGKAMEALQQSLRQLRQAVMSMEQSLKSQFAPGLGEAVLPGTILQVLSSGFQVKLDDTGLVGFVSSRDLPGKLSFDPVTLRLSNDQLQFQLDQPVQVQFREIDRDRNQIKFTLILPTE